MITYRNPYFDITGDKCPICSKTSWKVFKCDCGEVFCIHCHPQNIITDQESECIEVTCPKCKTMGLFV